MFDFPKTTNSLLLTKNLVDNINNWLTRILYIYFILYSYNKKAMLTKKKLKKLLRENTFTVLYWKKSRYKWTFPIQTCIVQESTHCVRGQKWHAPRWNNIICPLLYKIVHTSNKQTNRWRGSKLPQFDMLFCVLLL